MNYATFCIWTPMLNIEMIVFVICMDETICDPIQRSMSYVELKVPKIGQHIVLEMDHWQIWMLS